jgi:catechol 2,3-dioxygenase-like lactoylglutathione lyase family enzyme
MPRLLINIDVPDLDQAVTFYTSALGLSIGRRLGDGFVELLGAEVPIYLLEKPAGTTIGPAGGDVRRYERHWSPVHLDIVVDDMAEGIARVMQAGAVQEGQTCDAPYGLLAMFADPFGHGFCLIEFNEAGYDAIATPANVTA